MIFYFLLFAVLCLYKIKLKPDESGFMADYMSVEKTTAIKGIFIIIVFFSHFKSYIDLNSAWSGDVTFYKYFSLIGQRMVTLFLFYSGYGVMESISKKGLPYVNSIPKRRLLHVLVEFDIAVIIFAVMRMALGNPFNNGKVFDIKQFVLSLIGWDSVGNSNWYIFSILVAYAVTFIAFEIFRGKKYLSVTGVTVLLAAFVIVLRVFNLKQSYWYDTIMIYALGMWYSRLRPYVEKIVMKNQVWIPLFVFSVLVCLYSFKFAKQNFVLYELSMALFVWTVLLFTMKVSICNKPLVWLGKNLFPLYIFQRLPMIILDHFGLSDFNIYLYFAVCFAVTLGIAWLFSKFSKLLWTPRSKRTKTEKIKG